MVPLAVAVAAVVLILTVLQSTFPSRRWVKHRLFKAGAVGFAVISGILMVVAAVRQEKSAEALEVAVRGVSRTVFPQDLSFEIAGRHRPFEASAIDRTIFVNVYVASPDSPHFGQWGVTHTPTLEHGVGRVFSEVAEPSLSELLKLEGGSGSEHILFKMVAPQEQGDSEVAAVLKKPEFVASYGQQYRPLEEYLQSQFLCLISGSRGLKVSRAGLTIKGQRVPFFLVPKTSGLVGVTVFRPTFERRLGGNPSPRGTAP